MINKKKKELRERQYFAAVEMHLQGLSQRQIARKIGVSQSKVCKMLCNFDPENINEVGEMKDDTPHQEKPKSREQKLKDENAALKAELRLLRKELDYQTIRGEVLDELINIAERDFKIEIRKKGGAKH